MDARNASPQEMQFVEEVALSFERQGLFRMAGRVFAWLLICDPPEQTFTQLVDTLQVSKGSISPALQFLTASSWVERASRPGDRRSYYRWRTDAMLELARRQTGMYGEVRNLMDKGLELLQEAPVENRRRLLDVRNLYDFLEREMPGVWARWERERHGGHKE